MFFACQNLLLFNPLPLPRVLPQLGLRVRRHQAPAALEELGETRRPHLLERQRISALPAPGVVVEQGQELQLALDDGLRSKPHAHSGIWLRVSRRGPASSPVSASPDPCPRRNPNSWACRHTRDDLPW